MELVVNMIKAKLFKNKDNVSDKYYDVAERVEDFINDNLINDVISIVRIAETDRVLLGGANLTYATDLLLIYREGNE
nr:MAG TPA: Sporulation protein Cse60 [Caudoviricetes sp.]